MFSSLDATRIFSTMNSLTPINFTATSTIVDGDATASSSGGRQHAEQ